MKCIIKEIAIFGEDADKKRGVELEEGLNIVTGLSKTGKSALIEITDYCLLSSTSTIPRGKITDYAKLFAIILEFQEFYLVIGRPSSQSNDWKKVYFNVEIKTGDKFTLEREYFNSLKLVAISSIKEDLGRYFGFDVAEVSLDRLSSKKKGYASFRNVTPFLFQHQNLITNKHALFYRFDNREKQEKVIAEFPIFMGWVDGTYYQLKRELDEKERTLRALKKEIDLINNNKKALHEQIERLVKDYYQIIGSPFPIISNSSQLIRLASDLPKFNDNIYLIGDYSTNLINLESQRNDLFDKKQHIIKQIEMSEIALDRVSQFNMQLSTIANRLPKKSNPHEFFCPLCENKIDTFVTKIDAIEKSRSSLNDELNKMKNYSHDNSTTIERLHKERDDINRQLLNLNKEINLINRISEKGKKDQPIINNVDQIKKLIELSIAVTYGNSNVFSSDITTVELEKEILNIEKELKQFSYNDDRNKFEKNLAKDMNSICVNLDFEEELGPPQLFFDSTNFTLTHYLQRSGEKISLSEMGSGANWLACHLSLFLGLHKQFAKKNTCSIPSFIFFDQPSQVYFPTDSDYQKPEKDNDRNKVAELYDVIITTLEKIKSESGFMPQIILTDHADDLPIKSGVFENFVRKRWRNGDKLI